MYYLHTTNFLSPWPRFQWQAWWLQSHRQQVRHIIGTAWALHGRCMGSAWTLHGLCMGTSWIILALSPLLVVLLTPGSSVLCPPSCPALAPCRPKPRHRDVSGSTNSWRGCRPHPPPSPLPPHAAGQSQGAAALPATPAHDRRRPHGQPGQAGPPDGPAEAA